MSDRVCLKCSGPCSCDYGPHSVPDVCGDAAGRRRGRGRHLATRGRDQLRRGAAGQHLVQRVRFTLVDGEPIPLPNRDHPRREPAAVLRRGATGHERRRRRRRRHSTKVSLGNGDGSSRPCDPTSSSPSLKSTSAQQSTATSLRRRAPWNSRATIAPSTRPRRSAVFGRSRPHPVQRGRRQVARTVAHSSAVRPRAWPRRVGASAAAVCRNPSSACRVEVMADIVTAAISAGSPVHQSGHRGRAAQDGAPFITHRLPSPDNPDGDNRRAPRCGRRWRQDARRVDHDGRAGRRGDTRRCRRNGRFSPN